MHHHHCALPGTKLTVTTVSSATENSRCVGITDGGGAPSSTQIFAGTDSTGTTSAKTATVQCTGGGAASCVLEMTGLVSSTPHDVYCTTNGGVVSSKLDVSTLGDTDCDSLGSCSGHGTCSENMCTCQDGYGSATDTMIYKSPKCDQRACPPGKRYCFVAVCCVWFLLCVMCCCVMCCCVCVVAAVCCCCLPTTITDNKRTTCRLFTSTMTLLWPSL